MPCLYQQLGYTRVESGQGGFCKRIETSAGPSRVAPSHVAFPVHSKLANLVIESLDVGSINVHPTSPDLQSSGTSIIDMGVDRHSPNADNDVDCHAPHAEMGNTKSIDPQSPHTDITRLAQQPTRVGIRAEQKSQDSRHGLHMLNTTVLSF